MRRSLVDALKQSRSELELIERTAFEMIVQALKDYLDAATLIFREEADLAQDIAEDVMREAVEAMGLPGFQERLYGKVDYKKSIYTFIPEARPAALMLDAKAEKSEGSATIQMSQTSMLVRYVNSKTGENVNESGTLRKTIERQGRMLHTVSIIAKFVYDDDTEFGLGYNLKRVIVACIPNRALQSTYNPSPNDTIWQAGRHAPKRGEAFRVRLSYPKLQAKAAWRVRYLDTK